MKLYTQITGLLAFSLFVISCEQSAEVYTSNEKISSEVFNITNSTEDIRDDGKNQPTETAYVHNNLSFDVANSGNSSALNVEIEVTIVTNKMNETTEILFLGELKPKEIRRMYVEKILIDEYFEEYYINVYWDEDDYE
jgi:hypothetical protein